MKVEGIAGLVAAPTASIVPYLTDHRSQIFASAILIGLGTCLFAWYLAGLRRFVSPDDHGSLGTASMLGGLLAAVVVLVALCVLAGVVLHVPGQELSLPTFDAYNGLVTIGGFGFGFSVVLQLATIPGLWVETGVLAPLGPMAVLAFVLLTAWHAAVAWNMTRRPDLRDST